MPSNPQLSNALIGHTYCAHLIGNNTIKMPMFLPL